MFQNFKKNHFSINIWIMWENWREVKQISKVFVCLYVTNCDSVSFKIILEIFISKNILVE